MTDHFKCYHGMYIYKRELLYTAYFVSKLDKTTKRSFFKTTNLLYAWTCLNNFTNEYLSNEDRVLSRKKQHHISIREKNFFYPCRKSILPFETLYQRKSRSYNYCLHLWFCIVSLSQKDDVHFLFSMFIRNVGWWISVLSYRKLWPAVLPLGMLQRQLLQQVMC